jgi:septal ring-binding cell division protein DamX
MVAMLVAETDRGHLSPGHREGQDDPAAPAPGPDGPASTTAWPDGHPGGLDFSDIQALRQLPERFAAMDMQVLRLGARLDALEAHQTATDRALARAAAPTTDTPATKTAEASPSPVVPAADTQSSRGRGGYGIQLAALKNPARVAKFLEKHQLDPRQVRIEKAGINTILILGLFPDQAKADAAIDSLPPTLKRRKPMVRRFAPGQEPPRLATENQDDPSRP